MKFGLPVGENVLSMNIAILQSFPWVFLLYGILLGCIFYFPSLLGIYEAEKNNSCPQIV